jgi:hypothetical protein
MQNQSLPKTSVGEAYYRRQIWFYNPGVTVHKVKAHEKKDVHFQVWTKDFGWMGANEIISYLYHFLTNYLPDTVNM